MPIGFSAGFAFGAAADALKWSGVPASGEKAAAAGDRRFNSAAGLGVVKMRSAAAKTPPPQIAASTIAVTLFTPARLFPGNSDYRPPVPPCSPARDASGGGPSRRSRAPFRKRSSRPAELFRSRLRAACASHGSALLRTAQ